MTSSDSLSHWLPVLWLGVCFLALFLIAELLHRLARVPAEYTRKLVHAGTGVLTLLFPVFLTEVWQVAILCGSFLVLLLISLHTGWLPSINAVERKTAGSWLYPIIVFLCFLFYEGSKGGEQIRFNRYYFFYLPLLLLAFCDPAAALAGGYWKRKYRDTPPGKTLAGSLAFFLLATLICLVCGLAFLKRPAPSNILPVTVLSVPIATTLAERVSGRGWDNFTVPAAAMLCIWAAEFLL